jgi:4-hydroxy-tetrahydrodipicolinate reductase
MSQKTTIAIAGCTGRMGKALCQAVLENNNAVLVGGNVVQNSEFIGLDIGQILNGKPLNIFTTDKSEELFETADVIIDFTTPNSTVLHSELAVKYAKNLVIGTTGFNKEQQAIINQNAQKTAILQSGNMSLGVNLLAALVKQAANRLKDFDIEILEMHHKHKIDAPSGTALLLGKAAAEGRGVDLHDNIDAARFGQIGARQKDKIGMAVLRGGSVVGDHTVIFAGEHERLELSHKAENRDIFAKGAVFAALWLAGKRPNLYSMTDVLE